MKKMFLCVLSAVSILIGGCTAQEVVNGIGQILAAPTSSIKTNDNNPGDINFPETAYYNAFKMNISYDIRTGVLAPLNSYSDVADIYARFYIESKVNDQLQVLIYQPVYNSDGNTMGKIKQIYYVGANDALKIGHDDGRGSEVGGITAKRTLYAPKEKLIVAVFYKNKIVGSNKPELVGKVIKPESIGFND